MGNGFRMFVASVDVALLCCGCEKPKPRVKVQKTIVEKLASTEQRLGYDFFDRKNHFRSRAETVYYLIADDGTMIEVDLKMYAKAKVGQSFQSSEWK